MDQNIIDVGLDVHIDLLKRASEVRSVNTASSENGCMPLPPSPDNPVIPVRKVDWWGPPWNGFGLAGSYACRLQSMDRTNAY